MRRTMDFNPTATSVRFVFGEIRVHACFHHTARHHPGEPVLVHA
ncbi:protein of unknown function [Azospirillum baldaniorum]|uniref:Uncharacterized protein n=1 Tax=Azospirillum baldaniorum TaxID=1064539 RepID=A0A9P1JN86_9PROT|nr:protein of unknown function [Azospirillum baldaniorum]